MNEKFDIPKTFRGFNFSVIGKGRLYVEWTIMWISR